MQGLSWGESYRGGMGHAEKQPKNDRPQNQDLIPLNSSLEGVQNQSFEYKTNYYNLLFRLYYIPNYIKKLLPDAPCIKITMA